MVTYVAVLITLVGSAGVYGAWHWFERREHRGGHARHDALNSPYAVADRIARECANDRARRRGTGRHHLREHPDAATTALLSGEMPLLSGYGSQSGPRPGPHGQAGVLT
jgi:hypothetical protein